MAIDPQEIAKLFGAKIVGEVPNVGGGPLGMARLAHLMHQRLTERLLGETDIGRVEGPPHPLNEGRPVDGTG